MDIPAREFGAMLDEYHLKWQKISAIKIGDTDTDTIRFIDIPWPNERVLNSNQYLQKEAVAKFFLTKDWPEVKKRSQQDILKEEKRRWMEHAEKLEKLGMLECSYIKSGFEVVCCVLHCIDRLQRSSHQDKPCKFCINHLIVKEKKK